MIIKVKADDGYKVVACGKITSRGVELRNIGDKGTPKLTFSISADRKKNGDTFDNTYLDCEAWSERAEANSGLSGGDTVLVIGMVHTEKWKGRDGEEKSKEVCKCDFILLECGVSASPKESTGNSKAQSTGYIRTAEADFAEIDDDDGELPFN